jgi:hypothetical protein
MTDLLPVPALTQQLMQRTLLKTAIALPFSQDVFLLETHIAGLRYYELRQLTAPLQIAAPLVLRREPGNNHDGLAIEILTATGQKLGYVPQFRNPVIARLMDAGKSMAAEIASIRTASDVKAEYSQIANDDTHIIDARLKIFLRD